MSQQHYTTDFIIYGREEAKEIYVTGTFDNWSGNTHKLAHIPGLYWIISLPFNWGEKVLYKYIIDGNWTVEPGQPTEKDSRGLENNVFTAPSKPDEVNEQTQDTALGGSSYLPTSTSARSFGSSTYQSHAPTSPITSSAEDSYGKSNQVENGGVEGVKKVGPGVVEATQGKSTVDESTLAKSEGLSSTSEKPSALPATAAAPAIGTSAPSVKEASAQTSSTAPKTGSSTTAHIASSTSSTSSKAVSSSTAPASSASSNDKGVTVPLGAADALHSAAHPSATSASAHAVQGQGLFSVVSHIASAAAGAVQAAAQDVVHALNDDSPASPKSVTSTGSELPKTATQTPAPGLSKAAASQPTIPSNETINKEIKAHPAPSAQASTTASNKAPAAALSGIANGDNTDKITRELASVDLNKTKQEVTGAVERLGELVAGGLSAIGAANLGGLSSKNDGARDGAKGSFPTASSAHTTSAAPSGASAPFSTTGHVGALPGFSAATFSNPPAASNTSVQDSHVGSTTTGVSSSTTGTSSTAVVAKEAAPASVPTPTGNTANVGSSDVISGPYTTTGKTGTTQSHKVLDFTSGSAAATSASTAAPAAAASSAKSGSSDVIQGPYSTSGKTGTTTSHKTLDFTSGVSSAATSAKAAAPATAASSAIPISSAKSQPASSTKVGPTSGISDVAATELKTEAKREERNNTSGPGTASGLVTPASTVGRKEGSTVNATGADKKREASSLGVASGAAAAGPPSTPKKADGAAANAPASTAPSSAGGYKTAPSTPSGTPSNDRKRKSSIFNKIKSALSPSNK